MATFICVWVDSKIIRAETLRVELRIKQVMVDEVE